MKNYIYDLETYPNFFCGVFNSEGSEKVFEISARKNDYEDLLNFYSKDIKYAIGFNNVRFDAQIMHWLTLNKDRLSIAQGSQISKDIFDFVQGLIETTNSGGFPPYAEWHFKTKQIDLFLINHYNNKNKMTS